MKKILSLKMRDKKFTILFSIFFFCILNFSYNVKAQDTIIRFIDPANYQENVPLMPQFIIISDWEIDSSSVTYGYPHLDSNIVSNNVQPTLTLIPDFIFNSLSNDLNGNSYNVETTNNSISMSNYKKGTYYLIGKTEKNSYFRKFIKY